jgi:excisionase family DNA binding protein
MRGVTAARSPENGIAADVTGLASPLLMTADETAALLGVSRSVVYRWDARGDIPRPVRIGRMKRWSRLDLIRWVERRCPPRHTWEADA